MIERYSVDERSLDRYYVFPFSTARRSRFMAFNQEWLGILESLDFDLLSQDGKIDYILLKNHLTRTLYHLEQETSALKETAPVLPFAETIISLREDLQKMQWIDGRKAAKALNDLKVQIDKTRMSLERQDSAIKKSVVRRAVTMTAMLRGGLDEWFSFYNGYDPLFTWWAAEPFKDTTQALQPYEGALQEKLGKAQSGGQSFTIMDQVGREVLLKELATRPITGRFERAFLVKVGCFTRKCASGTWDSRDSRKTASECSSGGCTVVPASSFR